MDLKQTVTALQSFGKIKVLNNRTNDDKIINGPAEQAEIILDRYPTRAVVFVSAWGQSYYKGPPKPGRTAIELAILRDGDVLARSDSRDSVAFEDILRTSASYIFILEPNTPAKIRAVVSSEDVDSSKNTPTQVHLSVVAIDAG
jgi:hypothetical protein